jgi:hypothetical protein
MAELKRQVRKMTYDTVADLQARVGFEANEAFDVEVKTVSTTIADQEYNQKNDTTLSDDGVVCIHATGDAGGTGTKFILAGTSATGSFTVTTDAIIEAGAELTMLDVEALGLKANKVYVINRVNDATGLDLEEQPIITADDTVRLKLINKTASDIALGAEITFNWGEKGN